VSRGSHAGDWDVSEESRRRAEQQLMSSRGSAAYSGDRRQRGLPDIDGAGSGVSAHSPGRRASPSQTSTGWEHDQPLDQPPRDRYICCLIYSLSFCGCSVWCFYWYSLYKDSLTCGPEIDITVTDSWMFCFFPKCGVILIYLHTTWHVPGYPLSYPVSYQGNELVDNFSTVLLATT